jgi:hypothetical protein
MNIIIEGKKTAKVNKGKLSRSRMKRRLKVEFNIQPDINRLLRKQKLEANVFILIDRYFNRTVNLMETKRFLNTI